jgi:hypothetical protein
MLTSAVVSRITWSFSLNQTKSKSQTHQIGKAFVLSWDDDQVYPWEPVIAPSRWTLREWGCPSLAFIVGTVSLRNLTNSTKNSTGSQSTDKSRIAVSHGNLSALVCTQNLQQVETDVTLDYPSMAINKNKPPRPDEATSKWIRNPASKQGGTAFQFVPKNMVISLNSPNVSSDSMDGSTEEASTRQICSALPIWTTWFRLCRKCTGDTWHKPCRTTCASLGVRTILPNPT